MRSDATYADGRTLSRFIAGFVGLITGATFGITIVFFITMPLYGCLGMLAGLVLGAACVRLCNGAADLILRLLRCESARWVPELVSGTFGALFGYFVYSLLDAAVAPSLKTFLLVWLVNGFAWVAIVRRGQRAAT